MEERQFFSPWPKLALIFHLERNEMHFCDDECLLGSFQPFFQYPQGFSGSGQKGIEMGGKAVFFLTFTL